MEMEICGTLLLSCDQYRSIEFRIKLSRTLTLTSYSFLIHIYCMYLSDNFFSLIETLGVDPIEIRKGVLSDQ